MMLISPYPRHPSDFPAINSSLMCSHFPRIKKIPTSFLKRQNYSYTEVSLKVNIEKYIEKFRGDLRKYRYRHDLLL